jgi:FkbM family methyltransferase
VESSPRDLPTAAAIYGAGSFGRRLRRQLETVGVDVVGVIDQAQPSGWDGLRWFRTDEIGLVGVPVIIGISNPMTDIRSIAEMLHGGGVTEVWSPVDAARALFARGASFENYWMTGDPSVFDNAREDIAAARASLADDESRAVFDQALLYRETGGISHLASPCPLDEQYFPPDVPFVGKRMRYVDVGAYDGDTIRALVGSKADLEAVIALEPDAANFTLMAAEAQQLSTAGVEVIAAPLGLSDRCEMLSFSGDGTAASSITASGTTWVQCVSLDELAVSWHPTHVKMDIEGAEASAIAGMRQIIQNDRPALAISAYHRPHDLWSLLLLIQEMDLGYRFWLRAYGHQTFDTVLYCIPPAATAVHDS